MYLTKIPPFIQRLYPRFIWRFPTDGKRIFLTFDDGPSPEITPWVLKQLERYKAKATFFLIGEKVKAHPELVHEIIDCGHSIGNHTFNHLNGRKSDTKQYLKNFLEGQRAIEEYTGYRTNLFRPPYGKITKSQASYIMETHKIVMMDVLSGDFDKRVSGEACYKNVVKNVLPGSIVLFHDSKKAFPRLQYVLPRVLEYLAEEDYRFHAIKLLKDEKIKV